MLNANMRTTRGLLYDDMLPVTKVEWKTWDKLFQAGQSKDRTYFHAVRFSWESQPYGMVVGFFGGRYDVPGQSATTRKFMDGNLSWAPGGNFTPDTSGFLAATSIVIHMDYDGKIYYWSGSPNFGNDAEFSATIVYPCQLDR